MKIEAVFFDVGETLIDETRQWGMWADWLGVTRLTFFAALGALIERGEHHRRVFEIVRPGVDLAREARFLGAQIGLLGVLQAWTRDLRYHSHVHYLAPGGGLADDGCTWAMTKADFLVHVKPLAALFRAKLRAAQLSAKPLGG